MCTYSAHKGDSGADVSHGLAHAPAHAHATRKLLGPGGLLEPEGVGGHPEPKGVGVHHPPEGKVVVGVPGHLLPIYQD